MKNPINLTLFCCLAVISISAGCSAAIDKVVDNQITKIVEEENKKLPTEVNHGVMLIKLEYHDDTNKLVMSYSVPDRAKFEANFSRIKKETDAEVNKNGSLTRAFDHGVRLFHEFFTDDELSGKPFKSFETRKRS